MIRRRSAVAALGALAAGGLAAWSPRPAGAETAAPFEFVALGDMPYGPDLIAKRGPAWLISAISRR